MLRPWSGVVHVHMPALLLGRAYPGRRGTQKKSGRRVRTNENVLLCCDALVYYRVCVCDYVAGAWACVCKCMCVSTCTLVREIGRCLGAPSYQEPIRA